jgi:hypothetical protein
MKKLMLGTVGGIALGAVVTWLALRHHAEPDAHAEAKKEAEAKHDGALHWTKEQQAAAGIATAQPKAVEVKPEVKAFGRVLDGTAIAASLGDIEAAQVARDASAKEFERVQLLRSQGDNASLRALETAEAAMKRDRVLLSTAQTRIIAAWGPALAGRSDLPDLAEALLKQKAALLRIDLLPGETAAGTPKTVRLAAITGEEISIEAEILGPAPSADPQTQGVCYLALLRNGGPSPGTLLSAFIPSGGEAEKGFLIPRGSIIRHDGEAFVWLQTGDDKFERKQVELGRALKDGILATGGVAETNRVVVVGAQQLLSDELKAGGGE